MTTRLTSSPILDDLDKFLGRGDFIASVIGGLVGYWYLSDALTQFFVQPRTLDSLLGSHAYGITLTLGVLFSVAIAFCAARIATNLRFFFAPTPPDIRVLAEKQYTDDNYEMARRNRNDGLYYGEVPSDEDADRLLPDWLIAPWKSVTGNLLALGATGVGKTIALLYPILEQFIVRGPDPHRKTAILILDKKGTIMRFASEVAKRCGRESDVVYIGVPNEEQPNPFKWNPFVGRTGHQVTNDLLASGRNSSGENSGDNAWIDERQQSYMPAVIDYGRCVKPKGEFTALDLHEMHIGPLLANISNNPELKALKEDRLEEDRLNFYARPDWRELEPVYKHGLDTIEAFSYGNAKNDATIISSTLTYLAPWVYPGTAEHFCPEDSENNFPGIEYFLENGCLVGLQASGSHPQIGVVAARMFKRHWQEAVLARVRTDANPPPAAMFIDECQSYLDKSTEQGSGDTVFLNQSRESNHSTFLFTQSYAFLEKELGGKLGARLVAAGCRTRIILALTDHEDQKQASDQLNSHWVSVKNESYVERARGGSSLNIVLDEVDGKNVSIDETHSYQASRRKIVEPEQIANLPNFEAWASIYDGYAQMPTTRLFLKPTFLPFETSHAELKQKLSEGRQ